MDFIFMFYIHGTDANHNVIMCLELKKNLKEKVFKRFCIAHQIRKEEID